MNLAGRSRRRPRSGPLSPALTGLVTFSFALLGMGALAYVSSLPSLVEASQRSDESSLYAVLVDGLLGEAGLGMTQGAASAEAGAGEPGGAGGEGNGAGDGSGSAVGADGQGASSHKGGKVTLGGVTLGGVISGVVQETVHAQSGPSRPSGAAPQAPDAGANNSSSSSSGPSQAPAPPAPPAVSAEEEQRVYNALLAKVNLIDGYVGEVNGLTSAFNNDCRAAQGVRQTHRGTAHGLAERLLGEYIAVRDGILVPNESRYKSAQGQLIRMYRLLMEYAYEVRDVWDNNLGPEPGDVNALLARLSASNNSILGEFRGVYGGFAL